MNNWVRFLLLAVSYMVLSMLINELIVTEEVYKVYFQHQISADSLNRILTTREQLQWLGYLILPIAILFKLFAVTICLLTGTYFVNIKTSIPPLFSATLKAEFVLLLPSAVLILWFLFIRTEYTLEDTQDLAPLSVLNLFDSQELESWEKYVLSAFNAFQVLYMIALTISLARELKEGLHDTLRLVLCTYVPGQLVWTVSVAFLLVSMN